MREDLGRADSAHAAAGRRIEAAGVAVQETGGIQVAGAGGVDDPDGRLRVEDVDRVAVHPDRATLAAGERRRPDFEPNGLLGLVEALDLEQRDALLLTTGRSHVCTPVTNAHHVCSLLLANTNHP